MTAIENIKNKLIDRILATKNEKFLEAISRIFESTQSEELINLSSEQIEMLILSDSDIATKNYVSESELNESDSKWLTS